MDIQEKLNIIEKRIKDKDFLENKGLGNEVGYYIFDYGPQYELNVREHIKLLRDKFNYIDSPVKIVEIDLYEMLISILQEEGYLNECFNIEKKQGFGELTDAIVSTLGIGEKQDNQIIINKILEKVEGSTVVFLTGVGKCYPIIRSHSILNNLHQVLDKVPVVMFFPGNYSGQELQLFGTIKDDNYYRAFKLI